MDHNTKRLYRLLVSSVLRMPQKPFPHLALLDSYIHEFEDSCAKGPLLGIRWSF